ncbi:hypothetical protein [Colwellia piezophila]|uniref:hypothetical protein n=1 Tax=Colwellia piezophila TaxID=211668 RepID=UPI000368E1F8|nr:hypothetical protein [Colwellia piezophila]
MYKKIALVTLLLSVSALTFAEADEVKKEKFKWTATEQSCGRIDAQIIKAKADVKAEKAPARRIKQAENKKAKCVAIGL